MHLCPSIHKASIPAGNSLFFGRTWLENDKLSDRDEEEEDEKKEEKEEEEGMPGSSRMEGESRRYLRLSPFTSGCLSPSALYM